MNNHSGRLTLEYHPRLVRPIHLVEVRPPTHAQVDLQQRAHDIFRRRRFRYQDLGCLSRAFTTQGEGKSCFRQPTKVTKLLLFVFFLLRRQFHPVFAAKSLNFYLEISAKDTDFLQRISRNSGKISWTIRQKNDNEMSATIFTNPESSPKLCNMATRTTKCELRAVQKRVNLCKSRKLLQ